MAHRTHPKVSVTLEPEAAKAAKRLAKAEGVSLSAWLSRASLREAKLAEASAITAELIAEHEAEHGPIPEPINEAARFEKVRREAFLRNPRTVQSYQAALASLTESDDNATAA